jgi:hypothetical protein
MTIRNLRTWFGVGLMVAVAGMLAFGCSQNGGGSADRSPGTDVGRATAHPESPELMERSYGYLLEGDKDFIRMAPNYSTLRPFNPDTSIVVETRSAVEGVASPPADFQEFLYIRLHREMPLRVIVADSTGKGLIVYDFNKLPVGNYTVGSKGWPVPQVELTKDHNWVYVYVVGDTRFRWRERFALDSKRNLVPLAPPAGGAES